MTEILQSYHMLGLAIGLCTFLIIGAFHPIVIKSEYHFGTGCWWVFLGLGAGLLAASIVVADVFWSAVLGVTAFSSFWTILELFEQRERVRKGWFPANPRRNRRESAGNKK